jgi:hypothetical protein
MTPGNAQALVSMMDSFTNYSEFPISLDGNKATIYHPQFAKYPIERAARVLHEQFPIDPCDYDDENAFTSDLFDCHDRVVDIIQSTPGLSAGIEGKRFFDYGQRFESSPLHAELTKLIECYTHTESQSTFEATRRIPENTVELVADLLTVYHVELASMKVLDISTPFYEGDDWTEREAAELLTAMRAVIETRHGWTTFGTPTPSERELSLLYTFCEEVGVDPEVDWIYGLYVRPKSAMRYAPSDSLEEANMSGLSHAINGITGINTDSSKWVDTTS